MLCMLFSLQEGSWVDPYIVTSNGCEHKYTKISLSETSGIIKKCCCYINLSLEQSHHLLIYQLQCTYATDKNGVAERMNRTLVESARSMLAFCGLSNTCWAEAINTATYVRNRAVTTAVKSKQTPCELWHGEKPDVSYFRLFSCMAYTRMPDIDRKN